MSKIISIQQPECFPWLGFFDKIRQVDEVIFLDNVQFKKRYFENRNRIRTFQGSMWLNVPVLSKGRYTQKIMDVEIDNSQNWQRDITLALTLNYKKTPFWSDFGLELIDTISKPVVRLVDFNLSIIQLLAKRLGLTLKSMLASQLETQSNGSELIVEICKKVQATQYLSGRDGRNYLNLEDFKHSGIQVQFQEFNHPQYLQFHGGFESAMSTIDLYFNHGPKSLEVIAGFVS